MFHPEEIYLVNVLRGRDSRRLPGIVQLVIERVEHLRLVAVHVEPPVADKVLLLKESPIGTEETEGGETVVCPARTSTNVEGWRR